MEAIENEDFLVELLLTDDALVKHIRQLAERRMAEHNAGPRDKRFCESMISAAVEETLESLQVRELLHSAGEQLRAKNSSARRRAMAANGSINAKSIDALIPPSKATGHVNARLLAESISVPSAYFSSTYPAPPKSRAGQQQQRRPPPLSSSSSSRPVSASTNGKAKSSSTAKRPSSVSSRGGKKTIPTRSSALSPSSSGRRSGELDSLEKIGQADLELDAKLLESPQLKHMLSRAKLASTLRARRERAEGGALGHAAGGGGEEKNIDNDEFLNVQNVMQGVGAGYAKGGLVGKKIDFGRRQKFDTAFPDFEGSDEYDTVDDWLKARGDFQRKKQIQGAALADRSDRESKAAGPRTVGASDGSEEEEDRRADAMPVSALRKPRADDAPARPTWGDRSATARTAVDDEEEWERLLAATDTVALPKESAEPVIPSHHSGCGAGVYIGADQLLGLEISPARSKLDSSYASDFEAVEADGGGRDPTGRRVSFPDQLVTDTLFHRSKYIPNEVISLFYTHDETRQFQADYSYEIYRAELLGLTWEDWWSARSQEDVDKEEAEEEERQRLIQEQNRENGEGGFELEEVEEELDDQGDNPFVI